MNQLKKLKAVKRELKNNKEVKKIIIRPSKNDLPSFITIKFYNINDIELLKKYYTDVSDDMFNKAKAYKIGNMFFNIKIINYNLNKVVLHECTYNELYFYEY